MTERKPVLEGSDRPLSDVHDLALLDLDGVVYVGPRPVDRAPDALAAAARDGMRLAYVTNNASRPPSAVAVHLQRLGIPVQPGDVVTSAQAAARLLHDRVGDDGAVFVIGGTGLFAALEEVGLRGVQQADASPAAVVSGYHPEIAWRTVMAGALLVAGGLPWVASNTDQTVPTAVGKAPGNGVLVDTVARFAGRDPVVAGKPEPTLFEESVRRLQGERPLVVGDRLDTDIEGARRAGLPSLLVLTGVTDLEELVAAAPERRPSYLAPDLTGLRTPHPVPEQDGDAWRVGGWRAAAESDRLVVRPVRAPGDANRPGGQDDGATRTADWWRAVAVAAWAHLDATGRPVATDGLDPPD